MVQPIFASAAFVVLALTSSPALAQGKKGGSPFASEGGGGGRDVAVSIPLALYGEAVARVEFNLNALASIAIEGNFKRKADDIDEDRAKETGESLVTSAKGGLLLISRYTDPGRLGGFYWALGLGWREMQADWKVRNADGDPQADLTLLDTRTDEQGVFHHRAVASGTTGHLRGGYRYVADEMPLMIGAYIGVRHFQSGVKDGKVTEDETRDAEYKIAPMTETERERLKRRYMTQMEPAIELGFIF